MKALLTATFSFSLKSQQVFLFFLWQLFLTECHAEYQAVKKKKKKKVCLFSRAGYQRPSWGKKKLLWKDTGYSKCSSPSKTWALFFFNLILYLGILNIRAKTQCLLPAVILLCWWEKNETETRKPCVRKKNSQNTQKKGFSCLFYVCKIICHLCYFRAVVTMTYPFPFSCPSDLHLIFSTFPLGNLEENKHSI